MLINLQHWALGTQLEDMECVTFCYARSSKQRKQQRMEDWTMPLLVEEVEAGVGRHGLISPSCLRSLPIKLLLLNLRKDSSLIMIMNPLLSFIYFCEIELCNVGLSVTCIGFFVFLFCVLSKPEWSLKNKLQTLLSCCFGIKLNSFNHFINPLNCPQFWLFWWFSGTYVTYGNLAVFLQILWFEFIKIMTVMFVM